MMILRVIGGFDYYPVLANPTLRRVSKLLDLPLQGNRREMGRIINHVQIGAASTQRVTELLKEPSLLIVTSSRDELLVTLANLYKIPSYRSRIVGLVVPGTAPVSTITQMILDRSKIPYMRTKEHTTAELYSIITEDVSKITADDTEKLGLIRSLSETYIDFDLLDGFCADPDRRYPDLSTVIYVQVQKKRPGMDPEPFFSFMNDPLSADLQYDLAEVPVRFHHAVGIRHLVDGEDLFDDRHDRAVGELGQGAGG